MTATIDKNAIFALPVPQRIELVREILDTLTADSTTQEFPAELRDELDRRVAAYRANPSAAKPWEVVKASLRSRIEP